MPFRVDYGFLSRRLRRELKAATLTDADNMPSPPYVNGTNRVAVTNLPTPDYYHYPWVALESVTRTHPGGVLVVWPDGQHLECHPLWLRENCPGPDGINPLSKENDLDVTDLDIASRVSDAFLEAGALVVEFTPEARRATFHPGWLRHVADGVHHPFSLLPNPKPWTTRDLQIPPTHNGSSVLEDDEALANWLHDLLETGLARLTCLPRDSHVVELVGRRIGALRDSNFGVTWHVSVDLDPNSTANTNARLPAHSDLPSRETPPGFQLLHCLENTVNGGQSTMTDGLAVIKHLQVEEPDVFRCLTNLKWTFFNRDANHDHRWTGPVIDKGDGRIPWTFRAFHPVRGFPAMSQHEIADSYYSMQRLGEIANSSEFQIRYELEPGDLVAFDNRRILHGRESFNSQEGTRQLRGTYLDADEVYSRMRVLRRAIMAREQSLGLSNTMEDEDD